MENKRYSVECKNERVVKNTTRILYKRCIFLRFEVKQHVSALYGHHQVL